MSSRWKERHAKTRKNRKCVGENPCQSEEDALEWNRLFCLSRWYWTGRGLWQPREIHRGEGGAEGRMRLLRARGSAELGKVASGSATQGLWLGNRKVGSQIVGENRSRLTGRGSVGEVSGGGRWERRASGRTKEKLHSP